MSFNDSAAVFTMYIRVTSSRRTVILHCKIDRLQDPTLLHKQHTNRLQYVLFKTEKWTLNAPLKLVSIRFPNGESRPGIIKSNPTIILRKRGIFVAVNTNAYTFVQVGVATIKLQICCHFNSPTPTFTAVTYTYATFLRRVWHL